MQCFISSDLGAAGIWRSPSRVVHPRRENPPPLPRDRTSRSRIAIAPSPLRCFGCSSPHPHNVDSRSVLTHLLDGHAVALAVQRHSQKTARSWATQLYHMERYPEHRFACSQAQQYKRLEQVSVFFSSPRLFIPFTLSSRPHPLLTLVLSASISANPTRSDTLPLRAPHQDPHGQVPPPRRLVGRERRDRARCSRATSVATRYARTYLFSAAQPLTKFSAPT